MLHIALYQPEIPPNTGNIIRLCANTGTQLHLIKPLGFALDDKQLRRAGLDYHEYASVQVHNTYADFFRAIQPKRIFACTTRSQQSYTDARFQDEDVLLFGSESQGLPQIIIESLPTEQRLRIPMRTTSRSLNLANAAAVILYEAWRQQGFI
ncbi:MAG: tRNA (uridine(34)/cytosine(34)/5-carboxymethylaminomethyluridine(34)-2'-O)-methyltransferase TrmL [Thiohalomonadaceae bacterium]